MNASGFEGNFLLEYVSQHYPKYAADLRIYREAHSFCYVIAHPDKPSLPFGVTFAVWDEQTWCRKMADAIDSWLDDRTEVERLPWQVFSAYV